MTFGRAWAGYPQPPHPAKATSATAASTRAGCRSDGGEVMIWIACEWVLLLFSVQLLNAGLQAPRACGGFD